jgi:hypothetical protein
LASKLFGAKTISQDRCCDTKRRGNLSLIAQGQLSTKKQCGKGVNCMDKKIIYAIAVVVVVVVAFGGFLAYQSLFSGTADNGGGASTTYTFGNATSIRFQVHSTTDGVTTEINFTAKNLDSSSTMKLRADVESGDSALSYIMSGNNAWNNEAGTWQASDYATDYANWYTNQFASYRTHGANWKTGDADIYYTDGGTEIQIFAISLNPTIDDALFTVS